MKPTLTLITNPVVHVDEWERFVREVYGRPYNLQQQDGGVGRGIRTLTVPEPDCDDDDYMHDAIPEVVNHEVRGVKLASWLARDPKQPFSGDDNKDKLLTALRLSLWWYRNFYPGLQVLANDLHAKGLLPAGEYTIIIDW